MATSQPTLVLNASEQLAQETRTKFEEFLETFKLEDDEQGPSQGGSQSTGGDSTGLYLQQLELMVAEEETSLQIDFEHINQFDPDLAAIMSDKFYQIEVHLRKSLQSVIRKHFESFVETSDGIEREFWVSIFNNTRFEKLRRLGVDDMGKFISFRGTVTRTSEVRPELFMAAFRCQECNTVTRKVEQQFRFTTPCICSNSACGNKTNWSLIREDSTFIDWQRVRVQESSDEVPAGSLPRTMDVILRNSAVENARAGDKVVFNGSLIVVPDVSAIGAPGERVQAVQSRSGTQGDNAIRGLKSLGARELTYKLCFLANSTQQADMQPGVVNIRGEGDTTAAEVFANMTPMEQKEIEDMKANRGLYGDLVSSLAPGVFGAQDVKKAMLLMLMGGVHKTTKEGINLRGDINIAIVGDPACAKSQLLKYIANFLPRAVYTSGKSSSAAGLTATVVKEPETDDYCIEAGALMLADNGICCIDEFDKMDVKDQVAIHEAMEQQTISIAKAGIQATLNARTSVFAAANPNNGQYDKSKPLRYNVSLPPAILSRFDLLHVMIDEPDAGTDRHIAQHIVSVHQKQDEALRHTTKYQMAHMQRFIKYARSIKPILTESARTLLVESYKRLRTEDAAPGSSTAYRITVRQLEALIRLSEARARVDLSPAIHPQHVREATRLLKASIISVDSPDVEFADEEMFPEGDSTWLQQFEIPETEQSMPTATATATEQDSQDAAANDSMPDSQPLGSQAPVSQPEPQTSHSQQGEATTTGGQQAEGADASASAQPVASKTRITKAKFDSVRDRLVYLLRTVEDDATDLVQMEEDQAALTGYQVGMKQIDLGRRYIEMLMSRDEIRTMDQASTELSLMSKIIGHLISKEGVLVELSRPVEKLTDDEGVVTESEKEFKLRVSQQRVLAISANYEPQQ